MASRHTSETHQFDCPKLGDVVIVTIPYVELWSQGQMIARQPNGFKCDGCHDCGVGEQTGPGSWTFDFPNKCVHPSNKKK